MYTCNWMLRVGRHNDYTDPKDLCGKPAFWRCEINLAGARIVWQLCDKHVALVEKRGLVPVAL